LACAAPFARCPTTSTEAKDMRQYYDNFANFEPEGNKANPITFVTLELLFKFK
jgi:hypothetical protein